MDHHYSLVNKKLEYVESVLIEFLCDYKLLVRLITAMY